MQPNSPFPNNPFPNNPFPNNPCSLCQNEPGSHSFYKIPSHNPDITLFYSCPAKASRYFDKDSKGVVDHFRLHLESLRLKNNTIQPWAYVLDLEGYTLRHSIQLPASIALVEMVKQNYSESLEKVWIIHYSWPFKMVMNILLAILPEHIKKKIELSNSSLQQIQDMSFLF